MTLDKKTSENGVYFLSVSLENVRCFGEKQTLDLSDGNGRPAQWTVILGDNGTGKTTLLEILENDLNPITAYYRFHRIDGDNSKFEFYFASANTLANKQGIFSKYSHEIHISLGNISVYPSSHLDSGFHPVDLIYSYAANRKIQKNYILANPANEDKDELINAEKWLLDTYHITNIPSEIQEKYKKLFEIVKETLVSLLPDVTEIRISVPSEQSPQPRAEFKNQDGWLLLSQLSLGYQTMTAWMVDLAARLFEAYPNSPNPIAEPAVVLIDEIDLHLHPKWQRTIMAYLSERFINTQFIVTAHSPLIVQAAENANIVVLKREGDSVLIKQDHQNVQGWRVDQLLTSDLFDLNSARSPHYENLLTERRAILSKAELTDEDQARVKTLESEIGDLPTAETVEDIQAMDIIRRAAQLLKTQTP